MQIEPAFEGFEDSYAHDKPQLIFTRLVSDLETPVSAFLKLAEFAQVPVVVLTGAEDEGLRVLVSSFAPAVCLVGKTWALHLEKVVKSIRGVSGVIDVERQTVGR